MSQLTLTIYRFKTMISCAELSVEERCPVCPLNSVRWQGLQPHQLFRVTTEVVSVINVQDEDVTKASLLQDLAAMSERVECADSELQFLIVETVAARMTGGCIYHEGPVLEMPEDTKVRINNVLDL